MAYVGSSVFPSSATYPGIAVPPSGSNGSVTVTNSAVPLAKVIDSALEKVLLVDGATAGVKVTNAT